MKRQKSSEGRRPCRKRITQASHISQGRATYLADSFPQLQVQHIEDAGKQAKEQLKTADEELVKSKNAYDLFGKRMEDARQKGAVARRENEYDNVNALRAQQEATQLRQRAAKAKSR